MLPPGCYEKLIAEKRDESEAVLASNDRLEGAPRPGLHTAEGC